MVQRLLKKMVLDSLRHGFIIRLGVEDMAKLLLEVEDVVVLEDDLVGDGVGESSLFGFIS